jgi:hypothetical protein
MILILCGLVLAALAGVLVWCASTRWWHYLVIAIAWVPLFPLVAQHLTGDVSSYLPASVFSAGHAGKDEVVLASAYSTIVLAIIFAAAGFWVIRRGWQRLMRR